MIDAVFSALRLIVSPPFRTVLFRSLAVTILLLVVVWFALQGLLGAFVVVPFAWLDLTLAVLAGLGLIIGMVFLVGPITSLIAGLFLDEIAGHVEQTHFPGDPPGAELPIGTSLVLSLKFFALVVLVNLVALLLLLVPGVNLVAFLFANGYLLGREYFELAAYRHLPLEEARALREANRVQVFVGGLIIAGFLMIPFVNLLTPLFATAFMVHLFKNIMRREGLLAR